MEFTGFTNEDFDVFSIDGLDARMEALKLRIQPKLASLGAYFSPALSVLTGDEMFAHVAKHARRTKNPPVDTWVAFANNPRGYKMLPHFEIGLWPTNLFIWFAIINEAAEKKAYGEKLTANIEKIHAAIPDHFVWSIDHTKVDSHKHGKCSKEQLLSFFHRLQTVKKAEILCGLQIDRQTAVSMKPDALLEQIDEVFHHVSFLYNLL